MDPSLEIAMEYTGAVGVVVLDESSHLCDLTEAQIGRNQFAMDVAVDRLDKKDEEFVRVVKPNLLFCIHQRDSEGVGRGEGESRRLSRAKGIIRRVVRGYGEEEVSDESVKGRFKEIELIVGEMFS